MHEVLSLTWFDMSLCCITQTNFLEGMEFFLADHMIGASFSHLSQDCVYLAYSNQQAAQKLFEQQGGRIFLPVGQGRD